MSVLVTGATGFVGHALVENLFSDDYHVVAAIRSEQSILGSGIEAVNVGNISAKTDWSKALKGVDVLIHCAARAHIMNDSIADPLTGFRLVNTAGTLSLARQAAETGVRRFIFVSSIGVNGICNIKPFLEIDKEDPQEPYALSKFEAEQGLLALGKETGMEVVIIRPPLVYGANAPGNFASLLKWMKKDIPLPFGAIHNQRSFVALDNLVSFIIHCIDHPKAANEVFLISDGEDVSTTELLHKVAHAFGKRTLLLSVPVSLMTLVAKLLGKGDVANRLFGSLQVDSSKARDLLGWKPVITMGEKLKKMAEADQS